MKKENKPPRWAERVLEWYCRREILEDLQGDLNEYFERRCAQSGPRRARLNYIVDVLKFIRPYTIKRFQFINALIHWLMLGSYIKTSGRNIVRHRLFSAINIIGLAISMSVGLLMITFYSDLTSYDKFHSKGNRIYRVTDTYQEVTHHNKPEEMASTSVLVGKLIQEKLAGIEDVVLMRSFSNDVENKTTIVPVNGLYATKSFFNVFSFHLLEGNPNTCLQSPYSMVLTERTAKKLFGKTDPIGMTVKIDSADYTITGLMPDVTKFSHLQFESLISFSTEEILSRADSHFMKWENIWSNYTYLLLPPDAHIGTVEESINKIADEQNTSLMQVRFKLQPLYQIVLGRDLSNQIGPVLNSATFWIIGGLTLIVILSACFNYTNLSIARSLKRSKEVGIRKVMGARKGHVLGQFLTESVIIAFLSLVIAFILFLLLRPQILQLAPELSKMISLDLGPVVTFYFVGLALFVGILAGLMPALFYAGINALKMMKEVSGIRAFRHLNLRKSLIVLQYTFSLCFIAATILAFKQYKYFLQFDLGYSTENILNINLQGNKSAVLKNDLSQMPQVSWVSESQMITSLGSYYGDFMKYQNANDSIMVMYNRIDENYLPLHNQVLIAGHNFTHKNEKDQETEIIVNERVLKQFDIAHQDPFKAIGEEVTVSGKTKLKIVGVVKDFHYGKTDSEIGPFVFRYVMSEPNFLNVKMSGIDWTSALAHLRNTWNKLDPIHPFDATFYSDQIKQAYSEFSVLIKVIGFLSFLAVSIASLGLFGMVVYITETRIREISIRKVLGANERNLIIIMSKGFLFLLVIAAAIALPATYFFFEKVVLSSFAYRAPIGIFDLTAGAIFVMGIAILMIGAQTLKVARSNPANVLKNE